METTEITVIERVKEVEEKSGEMLSINLVEVSALANKAAAITEPKTDEDFVQVIEIRKGLAKYRKTTSDFFMGARKEFNRMSKGVIEIENQVLDTFVPEENRMKAFEKDRKEQGILEARKEALPAKLERLVAIGDAVEVPDELILSMEDAEFELYIVGRQGEKNEADRIVLEEAKAKVEADIKKANDELEAKKAEDDRVERAREEERELAEEKLQLEKDKVESDKKELEDKKENDALEAIEKQNSARITVLVGMGLTYDGQNSYIKDDINVSLVELKTDSGEEWATKMGKIGSEIQRRKEEVDKKAAEELRVQEEAEEKAAEDLKKAEQEANKKYQAWLLEIGCTGEETVSFQLVETGKTIIAYKQVSILTK